MYSMIERLSRVNFGVFGDLIVENVEPEHDRINDLLDRQPLAGVPGEPGSMALRRARIDRVRTGLAGPEAGALINRFLSPAEAGVLAGFRLVKRRAEWLAGRLAAKAAALALLAAPDLDQRELSVLADQHGRPRLAVPGLAEVQLPTVSISHSGCQAVALAVWSPCGVDVQEITPQLARVRERFVSLAEQEMIAAVVTKAGNHEARTLTGLGLLWTAKEALRKVHGVLPLPGFHDFSLAAVSGDPERLVALRFRLTRDLGKPGPLVRAFVLDGYAVAWTIMTELLSEED